MSLTIGFLKPDCLERKLEKPIYNTIEQTGLRICFRKRTRLTQGQINALYANCKGNLWFEDLVAFIQLGEIEIFVAEGENAIERLNTIVGESGSSRPSPGTIREKYAEDARRNVIHATFDEESFVRELKILLTPKEVEKIQRGGKNKGS